MLKSSYLFIKKKTSMKSPPATSGAKAIRLKPFTSDYQIFTLTTNQAMGVKAIIPTKSKPNMHALSLMNLDY